MSELVVYLGGQRVGRLIQKDNGNLQFRYDADYDGAPVSQSMPLQQEAHPHSVCRAVFGGLLLEGEARETIARNFGVSVGNDYALLEELGGDCAGALTLLPPDVQLPSDPETRSVDENELDDIVRSLPERPLAADPDAGIRLSLAGAQPKLPVIISEAGLSLPMNSAAATTHIVKPEPRRFPGLVDNEAFCMDLARAIELRVARVEKGRTVSGTPYLLVERYDRDPTVDPIRRLHQEDVCQALGYPAERKYQADGGPSVLDAVELLRRASAVPAQDLPRLWRALVFNWLIGNCDAHAKNFSLLYDAGAPTLAPLYDLVSTTIYPDLKRRLAMNIGGARAIDEVTGASWRDLAYASGYSERFARASLEQLVEMTVSAAHAQVAYPRHDNQTAHQVLEGVVARAHAAAWPGE
jgi:serine/threonine-protein kinase HipA